MNSAGENIMPNLLRKYWLVSRPAHLQFGRDISSHLGNYGQTSRAASTQKSLSTSQNHVFRSEVAQVTFLTTLLQAWQTPELPGLHFCQPSTQHESQGSAWSRLLPPYKAFIDVFIHESIHHILLIAFYVRGFVTDARHMVRQNRPSPCPHRLENLVVETGINQITTRYKKKCGPMSA